MTVSTLDCKKIKLKNNYCFTLYCDLLFDIIKIIIIASCLTKKKKSYKATLAFLSRAIYFLIKGACAYKPPPTWLFFFLFVFYKCAHVYRDVFSQWFHWFDSASLKCPLHILFFHVIIENPPLHTHTHMHAIVLDTTMTGKTFLFFLA